MEKTFYRCDPDRNTECRKRMCYRSGKKWATCKATRNPEYAVRDDNGAPIVEFVVTRGEDNGTD